MYMRRHQGAKAKHFDVTCSNVIYHKFSHGAVSYTLNGENVNVMLESKLNFWKNQWSFCEPNMDLIKPIFKLRFKTHNLKYKPSGIYFQTLTNLVFWRFKLRL